MELYIIEIFGILMIGLSFMVVIAKNLVHSVIALIIVFFNGAGLCFINGYEYIGLVLIIIYIGAIAVLFLFIVLMINIRENKNKFIEIISILFIIMLIIFNFKNKIQKEIIIIDWINYINYLKDIEIIGLILYSKSILYVIIAGIILLVAMIGSIILTLIHSESVKRQNIFEQNERKIYSVYYKNQMLK